MKKQRPKSCTIFIFSFLFPMWNTLTYGAKKITNLSYTHHLRRAAEEDSKNPKATCSILFNLGNIEPYPSHVIFRQL